MILPYSFLLRNDVTFLLWKQEKYRMLFPNNYLLLLPPIVTKCHRMNVGTVCQMEQEVEVCTGSENQHARIFQVIARQCYHWVSWPTSNVVKIGHILASLDKMFSPQAAVAMCQLWCLEPRIPQPVLPFPTLPSSRVCLLLCL